MSFLPGGGQHFSSYFKGAGSAAAPAGVSDNFDDNTIDPLLWTVRQMRADTETVQTTISVAETGGQLVMTSGGDSTLGSEGGYISGVSDFTGKQVSAELVQIDLGFGIQAELYLHVDVNNRIRFHVDGNLNAQERHGGGVYNSLRLIAYNATNHKFLRLHESQGNVIFEYSADGATWTLFYIYQAFALTALKIFLAQTSSATGVTAGKLVKYDNYALGTNTGSVVILPTNVVGGTFTGWVFGKTAADSTWGNSGFSSTESITGDGFIEWIITETNKYRIIGLSTSDPDQDFTSVLYGWFFSDLGTYDIYESGAARSVTGPYVANVSVFRIERVGTTLTYYLDGVSKRAVAGVTAAPLFVDTAFYTIGGTIGQLLMGQ